MPDASFFDIFKANNDPKIKVIINLIDDIFNAERVFRRKTSLVQRIFI